MTRIRLTAALLLGFVLLSGGTASSRADEGERHVSTGEKVATALREKGVSENATIVAIATLPIVELRGAIPVGHFLQAGFQKENPEDARVWLNAGRIFLLAVAGNMLPVPFILLLLGPASRLCMKISIGKKFFDWLFARTRRKTADIEKYEFWGLAIFVAIPLPATGAWTGAMGGWLMGIPFGRAMLSIFIGVCIAGVIMTALSLLGWIGAGIAGAVLLFLLAAFLGKSLRKRGATAA